MELENDRIIAQAAEAEQRRKKIAQRYSLTEQEGREFGGQLNAINEQLQESPSLLAIAESYDSIKFDSPRAEQVRQAFVDSALGKISESIRYFLPEAKEELIAVLQEIADQLDGKNRKFNSFSEIYNELSRYKNVFAKHGVDENAVARAYIEEARSFHNR